MKEKPVCVEQGQKLAKEVMSPCWISHECEVTAEARCAVHCVPGLLGTSLPFLFSALVSQGKTVSLTVDEKEWGRASKYQGGLPEISQ